MFFTCLLTEEVAAMGKGKPMAAETADTVTTCYEFETKRKLPWGSLEGDYSSSDGSPRRESASPLFSF